LATTPAFAASGAACVAATGAAPSFGVSEGGSCSPPASSSSLALAAPDGSSLTAVDWAPASTSPVVSTNATGVVARCQVIASIAATNSAGINVMNNCPAAVCLATPALLSPTTARHNPARAFPP
jgi:hypothetical protein